MEQSSLEITDHDSTGLLQEVIATAIEDLSSVDVSVMEEDEHKGLLQIGYEDIEQVQDFLCTITMLCMSMGVFHYTLHYMGKEGGVVR
jgi:predicted secreted protein